MLDNLLHKIALVNILIMKQKMLYFIFFDIKHDHVYQVKQQVSQPCVNKIEFKWLYCIFQRMIFDAHTHQQYNTGGEQRGKYRANNKKYYETTKRVGKMRDVTF